MFAPPVEIKVLVRGEPMHKQGKFGLIQSKSQVEIGKLKVMSNELRVVKDGGKPRQKLMHLGGQIKNRVLGIGPNNAVVLGYEVD